MLRVSLWPVFPASGPRSFNSSFHPSVHRRSPSNTSDEVRTIALPRMLHASTNPHLLTRGLPSKRLINRTI